MLIIPADKQCVASSEQQCFFFLLKARNLYERNIKVKKDKITYRSCFQATYKRILAKYFVNSHILHVSLPAFSTFSLCITPEHNSPRSLVIYTETRNTCKSRKSSLTPLLVFHPPKRSLYLEIYQHLTVRFLSIFKFPGFSIL